MDKDVQDLLYDFLGIEEGSTVDEIVDFGLSAAPIISKVYNYFKRKRFIKRIEENEEQINRINQKLFLLDDPIKEMIQNIIFPYILDDLIEEHQEMKVKFILNGFEYIVEEKIDDESYVISYYDVLRDLRVEDIKRLLEYTRENQHILESRRSLNKSYLNYSYEKSQAKKVEIDKFFEEESYRRHIDYKLESKGLIGNNREKHNEALLQLIEKIDERSSQRMSLNNRNSDYTIMDINRFKSIVKKEIEYELTSFGYTLIKTFNLRLES